MKKFLASVLFAASLTSACSGPHCPSEITVRSADIQKTAMMTVTGSATLEISPDCADLTMTLRADGERPAAAAKSAQEIQDRVVAALGKLGVESADIKLSQLHLYPVYAQSPGGWSTLKVGTYRADITVTVTTRRFDRIAALMEAGADAGASEMSSQFRRSDLVQLKKKVRDMALTAAKEKAEQTARTLGVTLGPIASIAEAPTGQLWGSPYVANAMETRNAGGPAIGAALQSLTLDVSLGFELATKT